MASFYGGCGEVTPQPSGWQRPDASRFINNVREANTQGDFAYVKLAPEADGKDWAATPACISVNAAKPAACGSLLMDTGVTTMYLTVPETTFSGREVAQPRW
jgi:hypothetical protein